MARPIWRARFEDVVADPTVLSIESANGERDKLRAQVERLERALAAAYTDVSVLTAERDHLRVLADDAEVLRAEGFRLRKITDEADAAFEKGHDQAVHEIRDHFAKVDNGYVVAVIEMIWMKEKSS